MDSEAEDLGAVALAEASEVEALAGVVHPEAGDMEIQNEKSKIRGKRMK